MTVSSTKQLVVSLRAEAAKLAKLCDMAKIIRQVKHDLDMGDLGGKVALKVSLTIIQAMNVASNRHLLTYR